MFKPIRGHKAPGSFLHSEDAARHAYRHRHENGLAEAFVKVQGRVLADFDRIQTLLAERAQREAQSDRSRFAA